MEKERHADVQIQTEEFVNETIGLTDKRNKERQTDRDSRIY